MERYHTNDIIDIRSSAKLRLDYVYCSSLNGPNGLSSRFGSIKKAAEHSLILREQTETDDKPVHRYFTHPRNRSIVDLLTLLVAAKPGVSYHELVPADSRQKFYVDFDAPRYLYDFYVGLDKDIFE